MSTYLIPQKFLSIVSILNYLKGLNTCDNFSFIIEQNLTKNLLTKMHLFPNIMPNILLYLKDTSFALMELKVVEVSESIKILQKII